MTVPSGSCWSRHPLKSSSQDNRKSTRCECEVRGDDIGGIAVHIGARESALAGANDVLVSSTLRDLVIGSGIEFDERGAHELKGVPGEWHLFAVASS